MRKELAMRFANHLGRNYYPMPKWTLTIDEGDWYLREYAGGICLITYHGKGKPGDTIPLPKGVSPHQVEIISTTP